MPCQMQMPSKDSGLEPQPCDRQDRYPGMCTWKLTASLPSLLPPSLLYNPVGTSRARHAALTTCLLGSPLTWDLILSPSSFILVTEDDSRTRESQDEPPGARPNPHAF